MSQVQVEEAPRHIGSQEGPAPEPQEDLGKARLSSFPQSWTA